jgi:hypothetical protein
MTIRIIGEGQCRAPETSCDKLNQIDNRIVSLVTEEKADEFRKELA